MKSRKIYLLLFLIIVCFVLSNCDNQTIGPEPLPLILGSVVDSISGEPIDSAQIIIGDTLTSLRFTYTNIEGKYTLPPDTIATLDVFCRKTEYITEKIVINIVSNKLLYNNINFKLIKK